MGAGVPDGGEGRIVLEYERGTVRLLGGGGLRGVPHAEPDGREGGALRAYGMHYAEIAAHLEGRGLDFEDRARDLVPSPPMRTEGLSLRGYQRRALAAWARASMRGCVVLPTGAGKTAVGMAAVARAGAAALVVVPTIDLMEQWAASLSGHLRADGGGAVGVGRLGGGDAEVRAVTVATYDSAYARAAAIGNRFALAVFDEVHHLPARGYRSIAEQLTAPYRLGLTATLEREDGLHSLVPALAGGVVFRMGPRELAGGGYLADYTIDRRRVDLTPAERSEHDRCRSAFLSGMRELGLGAPSMGSLRRLIMMSNRSRAAREALLARNRAAEIALNSSAKVEELRGILAGNAGARTIVFTQNNRMVRRISDEFLVPSITHRTPRPERREVLDGFRSGRYGVVATSKVLDEGVDVPDAQLGVVLSGTGSGREMIQRLGRLLRPKPGGAAATIIEIVSRRTGETSASSRRMSALARGEGGGGGAGRRAPA